MSSGQGLIEGITCFMPGFYVSSGFFSLSHDMFLPFLLPIIKMKKKDAYSPRKDFFPYKYHR